MKYIIKFFASNTVWRVYMTFMFCNLAYAVYEIYAINPTNSLYFVIIMGTFFGLTAIAWHYRTWKAKLYDKIVMFFAKDIANKFNKKIIDDFDDLKSNVLHKSIPYQSIYDTWPNGDLRKHGTNLEKIMDVINTQYRNKLEMWLSENMESRYFLWSDSTRLNLLILSERDQVLWILRFNDSECLPSPHEVIKL